MAKYNIGDKVILNRDLISSQYMFEKGTKVTIIGCGEEGYNVQDADGCYITECGWDLGDVVPNELIIKRKRFVVMTSDKKRIFCGLARHYMLKDVTDLDDTPIKTYMSEKKAKSSFLSSWWDSKEEDFNPGGKYVVVPVMESVTEI